jgi:chorismate synthase
MMGTGNSFGRVFRISTWGESHGGGVGVTLDGCPPRIHLTREDIQKDLDRRRPGQSRITTPRNEADAVEIMSGMTPEDITLGTPIAMLVRNKDQRSQDYLDNDMKVAYRPSHSDATYDAKYGVRAIAGGGRSSARETIGRVAAGAVARKILKQYNNIEILAYVSKVQDIEAKDVDHDTFTMEQVDANMVRCPDPKSADIMLERIDEIRKAGNSIGGVVTCIARNVPAGLGSPVFDKLEADLAKACMSIPAAKGFESGSGFEGTLWSGKDHNDEFYIDPVTGATRTKTNRSGGIQGGISNGENIVIKVAFKPTSTIGQLQGTVTQGEEVELRGKGRHDPCVLPRAVPMVEAMVALTLVDALMLQIAQCDLFPNEEPLEKRPNPMGVTAKREGGPLNIKAPAGAASGPVSQRVDEE